MAKQRAFQRFISSLKRHWRTALPTVKPLRERLGLPMASSFDAGVISHTGQRVYLQFETTWKEAGYFTISFVVVDDGRPLSLRTLGHRDLVPGVKAAHGAHRIGAFLPGGEKWWHLCDVKDNCHLEEQREFMRNLRSSLRERDWTAPSYQDEGQVIDAAVADVTRDVTIALEMLRVVAVGD